MAAVLARYAATVVFGGSPRCAPCGVTRAQGAEAKLDLIAFPDGMAQAMGWLFHGPDPLRVLVVSLEEDDDNVATILVASPDGGPHLAAAITLRFVTGDAGRRMTPTIEARPVFAQYDAAFRDRFQSALAELRS